MTAASVLRIVAAHYGVTVAQLTGPSRVPSIARARMVAYVLMRDGLGMSYPAIGRAMHRDHSTVLDGCRQVSARLASPRVTDDYQLAGEIAILRGHLARVPSQMRREQIARLEEERVRITARIAELQAEEGRENVQMGVRP